MMITNKVSLKWMEQQNMVRGMNYGIPLDIKNLENGMKWKTLVNLENEDFDKLDEYYEYKQNQQTNPGMLVPPHNGDRNSPENAVGNHTAINRTTDDHSDSEANNMPTQITTAPGEKDENETASQQSADQTTEDAATIPGSEEEESDDDDDDAQD